MPLTSLLIAALVMFENPPTKAESAPPALPREFRAAWVATVGNIDWPSRPGLTPEAQRLETLAILDLSKKTGINTVVLQVRASADAFYDSPFEPWSAYLTGQQGVAPSPGYDPLAFWVEEAHKRGLLLHAWFNPFRARVAGARYDESDKHISKARPDLVRKYGETLWLDPGEPEAREITLKVVLDIVRRYDVDGVHIDDYFYPYPIADPKQPGKELDFPDDPSWAKARASGVTLNRADWRRDNINRLVEQVAKSIKAEKPHVLFGISPFGIPRPGLPPGVKGFDQYDKLYADAILWLDRGWADYFSPQLYWKVDAPGQPFKPLLDYWIKVNSKDRHIWPGLSISRVREGNNGYDPSEILRQIAIIRETPGATGNVLFSFKALQANRLKLTDKLREGPYQSPSLMPTSPWLGVKSPGEPTVSAVYHPEQDQTIIEVKPGQGDSPFLWAIHTRKGDQWTFTVHPASEARLTWPGEVEALSLSAIDRLGNASEAVKFTPARRIE
jgi:uncharacterized lipoprotein YddW (UPF0748 family)